MTVTSVANFVDVLREHQFLEPQQLEEVDRDLLQGSDGPQALARLLVQKEWLTPYQVEQLLHGQEQDLVLGPYRLLEPVGEGGMGMVFKAVHQRLNRVVALKVIRRERLSQDPEAIRRFQREARAAAQLAHPNVVLVYDSDQIGSTYYIAMEYVEGIDLSQMVKEEGPLPVAQACDFIRQAALGLQHAHECGMVHRDIKPSNLLVTTLAQQRTAPNRGISGLYRRPMLPGNRNEQDGAALAGLSHMGGTGVNAQPIVKILDMGLVRLVESADGQISCGSLTREGSVMGTPDYIAPEQARNAHRVDIRADLYSLGCTLYFLLTGRTPFPEGSLIEKLLMHQMDEPRPIDDFRPQVPAEIQAVVHRLMAKRPEDRFQTPAEVAEVLASVKTVDPSPPIRRPASLPSESAPSTAVVAVQSATPTPPTSQIGQRDEVVTPKKIATLPGHRGWVVATAFAPNRDLLASGGVDGNVRLWDFRGKTPTDRTARRVHPGAVHSLVFSPDNQLLASGSGALDGLIVLWQVTEEGLREKAMLQRHKAPVDALAFAPDCKLLASGGNDRIIWLWDLTATQPREKVLLKGHTDIIKAVAFAPDSKRLASGSQDGTIRLWSVSKIWCREQAVLQGHRGHVLSVQFAPDGTTLASTSADETVRVWDLTGAAPTERAVLEGHMGVVRRVQFAPDGQALVSVGDRGRVILWDLATGSKTCEWLLPKVMVSSVAFTFDGRYLAIGTSDGTVFIFRLGEKKQ